jgi:hypothetical protein
VSVKNSPLISAININWKMGLLLRILTLTLTSETKALKTTDELKNKISMREEVPVLKNRTPRREVGRD